MNVSIGKRWEEFVSSAVKLGRYNSSSEVVREGLRLVEEREAKLLALKETLSHSLSAGGNNSDDDVAAHIDAVLDDLVESGEIS